jgi:type IV secretory pathway TraG/TraD family ATPase VirD4
MNTAVPAALLTAFVVLCSRLMSRTWRPKERAVHKRGVLIADGRPLQRRCARCRRREPELVTLAGVNIAPGDESRHFKVVGTTGTGKSTAIRELLSAAIARGDRAIFADPDAGYLRCFYDRYRGDSVLNPFEPDSLKWDLFAEIDNSFDVDQLAQGLIPASDDPATQEWRAYARTFIAALIRRCRFGGARDPAQLWRLLTIAPAEELRLFLAGTPAQPFLESDNARMFASIRSVAGSALAAFEHIQGQRALPFSVRQWVRRRGHAGQLFIPYRASQIAALRSLIATWMNLAIFETMSRDPHEQQQRLWFVIDELDALGPIGGLKDALARLRKFSGCCVLSFQSIAQVSDLYGSGHAQTLVENCATTLILRCSGSEHGGTSQFASRLIGERELLRRQVSHGRDREAFFSARGVRRSRSTTHQSITETAVLASELEQLPDLCGYLKRASSPSWLKVDFSRR